jgi:hypothetical protein
MAKIPTNMKIPIKEITVGNLYISKSGSIVVKATGKGQKENQFAGVIIKTDGTNDTYVIGYESDSWYNNNFNDYTEQS